MEGKILKSRREELGFDIERGAACFNMTIDKYEKYENDEIKAPKKVKRDMLKEYNRLLGISDGDGKLGVGAQRTVRSEFAFFIKSMRNSIVMDHGDFADQLGLDPSDLSLIESGHVVRGVDYKELELRVRKIVKEAKYYGGEDLRRLSVGELWCERREASLRSMVDLGMNCIQIAVRLGLEERHVSKRCRELNLRVDPQNFYISNDRVVGLG